MTIKECNIQKFIKKSGIPIHSINLGDLSQLSNFNQRQLNGKRLILNNTIKKIILQNPNENFVFIRFNIIMGRNRDNHGTEAVIDRHKNKMYYFNSNGELSIDHSPDIHELALLSNQDFEFIDVMKNLKSVNIGKGGGDCGALTMYFLYLFDEHKNIAKVRKSLQQITKNSDVSQINNFILSF